MRSYSKLLMMMGTLLLVVLSAIPAHAQTAAAMINGRITDPQGLVVSGAEVRAVNIKTNIPYVTKSNDVGLYSIPSVPVGTYRVIVEKEGFVQIVKPDVQLHVQDIAELNFSLQIGSITQSVTVEGGAPLVSMSPSVSTVVDRQFVGNLPLNGRSFQSLILLTPGVTVTSTSSNDLGQFSVNGQRASTNYFTVDGVSANVGMIIGGGAGANPSMSGTFPGLSVFGGTNNLVSVDALEEFKIQTSTYSAEFGRQPGGQVSIVTRSGSNQFHGTLFEYLRNDALDARDYFNKVPGPKPALRQNDFGGTFSGPIFKDKTFFFFSYEGQRLRLPLSGITYVPSLRVRTAAVATIKPILTANPLPTGPEILTTKGSPSGWSPYDYGVSNPGTMNATSIRIDHTFNPKLTLFGRFNESPSNSTNFYGGAYGIIDKASTRTLTLGAVSALTPGLTNELRLNYSRQLGQEQYIQATYGGAVPADPKLFNNGYEGMSGAFIYFGGMSASVYGGDYSEHYQRQMNIVDNVSLVKGTHQFKFGIDYRRLTPTYALKDYRMAYFLSEAAITSGVATFVSIISYDSARPRFNNLSIYGQDTWKITPRLTLDLGLRWELNPAPTEADGKMPAVVIGVVGNDVSRAALAPPGTPFYKTFYTAFAPRFGVAYQLNSTSGRETVLRGGFGVYYDLGSAGATGGYPLSGSTTVYNAPFPLSATDAVPPPFDTPTSLPTTASVYCSAEDLVLPYSLQWNAALEQSLGRQQSVSLSYVASAGRRLLWRQNLNYPANVYVGSRANPNFGAIYYTWNGPTSDYHSMQAQYKARFTRGLQALVNYTWSHAIDEVSSDISSFSFMRGNADFDVRHNFSAALTYNLPSPNTATVLKHLLRNWTIDGIVHAQTGRPVNVTGGELVSEGEYVSVRPDVVPGQPFYVNDPTVPGGRRFNSAAFKLPPTTRIYPIPGYTGYYLDISSRQGTFGRNVLRELPISQIDFALGRSFKLTENFKVQFKGELFNIFNHPMFGSYGNSFVTPSTFGVPTATLSRSLGGLNYLYQMGGPRSVQLSLKITF